MSLGVGWVYCVRGGGGGGFVGGGVGEGGNSVLSVTFGFFFVCVSLHVCVVEGGAYVCGVCMVCVCGACVCVT